MNKSKSLWAYRGFVWVSVLRDLQKIYQGGALLGRFLVVARPLAMVAVYTLVFSHIMTDRVQHNQGGGTYAIFLCSGLFTWFYFNETIVRGTTIFQEYAGLIQRVAFPRLTLPVIQLFSMTINFLMIAVVFIIYLIIEGQFPGWVLLGFIPLLIIQQMLALGLGVICGYLQVFFGDFGHLVPVVIQCWFWATPIVYPLGILPPEFRSIVEHWNPMTPVIQGYQGIVMEGVWPNYGELWGIGIVAFMFLCAGYLLITYGSDNLADEV